MENKPFVSRCSAPFPRDPGGVPERVEQYSHFSEVLKGDVAPHGRSRKWGDAPLAVQRLAAQEVIAVAGKLGFSRTETAFALAVVRTESGFNPDAAAGATSASGLGQLIDSTAESLGLAPPEKFSITANVKAALLYLKECLDRAGKSSNSRSEEELLALAYAYYHDGPSLKFGGRRIGDAAVVPWAKKFKVWLEKCG